MKSKNSNYNVYMKLPKYKLLPFLKEMLIKKGKVKKEVNQFNYKKKDIIVNYILNNFKIEELPNLSFFEQYTSPKKKYNFEKLYGLPKKPLDEEMKAIEEDNENPYIGKAPLIQGKEIINLKENQKKFLQGFFISNLRCSIIFHGVGTGKTLTAVSTSRMYLQLYPKNNVIFISPPAVLFNFIDSMVDFGIDPRDKRYSFFTYDGFYRSKKTAENSLLIVDEAHNFRTQITTQDIVSENGILGQVYGPTNKKGVQLLNRGGKLAHKVILLTATPFINKPYDIENLIAIGTGSDPLSEDNFGEIASGKDSSYDYFKFKISKYMQDKDDPNYPRRDEKFIPLIVKDEFKDKIKAISNPKTNPFYIYTRQASDTDKQKFDYVLKKILEFPTKKFVCYTAFQEFGVSKLIKMFNKNKIDFAIISGAVSTIKKQENISGYNNYNNPDYKGNKYRVLIITKAGAEGVSLTETKGIYVLSGQWNTSLYEQIVARAIRYKSHTNLPKNEQVVEVNKLFVCYESEAKIFNSLNDGKPLDFNKIKDSIIELRLAIRIKQANQEGKKVSTKELKKQIIDEITDVKINADYDFEKAKALKKGKQRVSYLKEELAFGKNKSSYVTQSLSSLEEMTPSTDYYLFILERSKQEVIDVFINSLATIPTTEKSIFELPFGKKLFNQVLKGNLDGNTLVKKIREGLQNNIGKAEILIEKSNKDVETKLEKLRKSQIDTANIRKQKALIDVGQEYFTPKYISDALIDFSNITKYKFTKQIQILEPSAGHGSLVLSLIDFKKNGKIKQDIKIDMIEFSKDNREELTKLVNLLPYYLSLKETNDFLEYINNPIYDFIYMNPPFHLTKATNPKYIMDIYDFDFVQRAYAMLAPKGTLVAITGLNFQKKEERFTDAMKWYKDHDAEIIVKENINWTGDKLKKGSEIKGVNIAFIKIIKNNDNQTENNSLLKIGTKFMKENLDKKKVKQILDVELELEFKKMFNL
jgi:hypothetical protein